MSNCAIDYYPSTYATASPNLMGINSANEGLLDAFLKYAEVDTYYCHVRNDGEFRDFRARLERLGLGDRRCVSLRNGDAAGLKRAGALFHPAPGFGPLAWVRRHASCRAYSLTGVTHTTATDRVMDSIGNLLIAPIQPWDAVICTSRVVRRTYDRVLADWCDYLGQRFGARPEPKVQLPVIPLGVDTGALAGTPERRAAGRALRQRLGAGPEDLVVLWVGRLNALAKSHPIPGYLALERLAQRLQGRKVFYLQAGWFDNDAVGQAFRQAARDFAPSVAHAFVDGREPDIRRHVWFAADLFLSLSDNIQETFGLTPIEAMAAELPVVVSDWDGYRDTVRDGVDGFRVPTWMPEDGHGEDLAREFAAGNLAYNVYTGTACQAIAVDLDRCTEALATLAEDPELRARMGASGRERAVSVFDWRHVIAAYQNLWGELALIRDDADKLAPRRPGAPAFPLRADPFRVFESYPTHTLTDATQVSRSERPAARLDDLRNSPLTAYALKFLADPATCAALLARLEKGTASVAELVGERRGPEAVLVRRSIAWLAKMGLAVLSGAMSDE
jgi:starch synthase